jgi:quinol monooxygenase YgiN
MSYVLILTIITSFGGVDTQRQTGFDSYQSLRRAHQRPWGVAMTVRNSSRPIARVFRATAAPGCRDELLQRFHSSSAALVNSKVGCLKYRILEPVDALAPEVVFESIWRDLDAVKVAFGDAWQQSHLPQGYSALMTAYSVHHFFVSESSTRSTPAPAHLE